MPRARFEAGTRERYEAADKAIDALIEANANAAHADNVVDPVAFQETEKSVPLPIIRPQNKA
jgi:hypothetical protein